MKNIKFFAPVAVVVFILAMVIIFMQPADAQRNIPAKDARQEIQERRSQAKSLRAGTLEERKSTRAKRMQLRGANVIARIDIRIDRLNSITGRINKIIEKMESSGTDTTKAKSYLTTVQTQIESAELLKTGAQEIIDSIETSKDLLTSAQNFKSKVLEVYRTLTDIKKNIRQSILELKSTRQKAGASLNSNKGTSNE